MTWGFGAGEFDDLLEEELMIVKHDVNLHKPPGYNHLEAVPGMKYVSARYKVSSSL